MRPAERYAPNGPHSGSGSFRDSEPPVRECITPAIRGPAWTSHSHTPTPASGAVDSRYDNAEFLYCPVTPLGCIIAFHSTIHVLLVSDGSVLN